MERATQERLVGATLLIVAGVILIPWLLDGSMTDTRVSEQQLVLPGGEDSGNETRRISLEVPDRNDVDASVREVDARSVRAAGQGESTMTLPTPEARQSAASTDAEDEASDTSTTAVPARFKKPMPESSEPAPNATAASTAAAEPPIEREPEPAPVVSAPPPVTAASSAPAVTRSKEASGRDSGTAATQPVGEAWAVQVGAFASQENAERLAERLRDKSYKAFVMRNVVDGRVRFRVRVGPVAQRSEAELLATALREDRQPARVLSHP